jgi:hypothetical protein
MEPVSTTTQLLVLFLESAWGGRDPYPGKTQPVFFPFVLIFLISFLLVVFRSLCFDFLFLSREREREREKFQGSSEGKNLQESSKSLISFVGKSLSWYSQTMRYGCTSPRRISYAEQLQVEK